jgi:hypothetical protein
MKKLLLILGLIGLLALVASAQINFVNNTNAPADSLSNSFAKINGNFGYLLERGATNTASSNRTGLLTSNDWQTIFTTLAALPDADTNSIVRSGQRSVWTTNVFLTTNNVLRSLPGTFTNPASITYTVATGTSGAWWRYSGGDTNWIRGIPLTTGVVEVAFYTGEVPTVGTPFNPTISNITVYALERPDLYNRTNYLVGQKLKLSDPTESDDAATLGWVSNLVNSVSYIQTGGLQLQGSALRMSSEWSELASTNGLAWSFLGSDIMRVRPPTLSYITLTGITLTNGVVWVRMWTNGVSATPAPQWSPTLNNAFWQTLSSYTNTYPTASGTNYTVSFPIPNPTAAFIRIAQVSGLPNFVDLTAMLLTAPRTVTNSTDSTWGNGSGVVTWDTNYLYISVGSNLWKRAALSSW